MDVEETGGLMELWADLYDVTHDPRHLELMRRYERPLLFEPLLRGEDVLTNMYRRKISAARPPGILAELQLRLYSR